MTLAVKQAKAAPSIVRRDSNEKLQKPTWASTDANITRPLCDAVRNSESYRDPRTEARRTAYEEGLQQAKSQVDAVVTKYRNGIAQMEHLRDQICRETEQQLVELALLIAREVVGTDLSARREFTSKMVDHVLSMLREAHTITLRLSPADCAAVKESHPELRSGSSVLRIVEDRACELGGVVAEADMGRIDATIERRLSEVARELTGPARNTQANIEDDLAQLLEQNEEAKP